VRQRIVIAVIDASIAVSKVTEWIFDRIAVWVKLLISLVVVAAVDVNQI